MRRSMRWISGSVLAVSLCVSGCQSDSHTGPAALFGGLFGAGTGAAIGSATGHPGAGAAIGAGVGAVSGAAVGAAMDETEARNRAAIEAQLNRRPPIGSVTVGEVIAMSQARVNEDVIINHVYSHGMVALPTTNDLIAMQQYGVSPRVVQAMQAAPPPVQPQAVVIQEAAPPPVVVEASAGPRCHRPCRYWW
jgi:hypothetical protein